MKVNEIQKYTTMEEVMKLSQRQRAILFKQCLGGRSCYIVDVNYNHGSFFQDCFDSAGGFLGGFVTNSYYSNELKKARTEKQALFKVSVNK